MASRMRPPANGANATHMYKLEQFKAVRELGTGSFGSVHQVVDNASGENFAMKVIEKHKVIDKGLEDQLKCEVLTQLRAHHPHVLGMKYYFEDSSRVYCLLEYADRGQLFAHLKTYARGLPEHRAAAFFSDTAQGVQYLHQNKIVHRDLKPENILLFGEQLHAKIGDLGWCAQLTAERPTRLTFCGTMDYLAPEVLKSEPHDFAVDLWALGVLLFEMLVARAPFTSDSKKAMIDSICKAKLDFGSAAVSPEAKSLIQGLLQVQKTKRLSLEDLLNSRWLRSLAASRRTPPTHAADAAAGHVPGLDATRLMPRGDASNQVAGSMRPAAAQPADGSRTPPLPVVSPVTGPQEAELPPGTSKSMSKLDLDSTQARDLDARMGQALASLDKSFVGRLNGHHDRERGRLQGIRAFEVPDGDVSEGLRPLSPSATAEPSGHLSSPSSPPRPARQHSGAFGQSLHSISQSAESRWLPPVGKDCDLLSVVDDARIDLEELDRHLHRQYEGGLRGSGASLRSGQTPHIKVTRGPRGEAEPAYLASALLTARGEYGVGESYTSATASAPLKARPKKASSKLALEQSAAASAALSSASVTPGEGNVDESAESFIQQSANFLGSFFGLSFAANQDDPPQR
mmetsp:Transcript_63216/g.150760  ORF Transcript_63216/g.150760 Transcript_63216/m.150760 type:complete len:628 (-) Transcript_63216:285-2168(-)